jgi:hypothetical protein
MVDAYMVRFNQGVVFLFSLLGFFNPIIWLLMALQLLITFLFGQKYCLPCRFYQLFIDAGFINKGPLKDSRPPRLANLIGGVFLGGAFLASLFDLTVLALVLAGVVGGLSYISSLTGFCLGCKFYILLARLRGIKKVKTIQTNLDDFLGFEGLVLFSHPLCYECQLLKEDLDKKNTDYLEINVNEKKDLAKKYQVLIVPALYRVEKGKVELVDI